MPVDRLEKSLRDEREELGAKGPLKGDEDVITCEERDNLGLRGLLPPRVFTQEEQVERILENFVKGACGCTGDWTMAAFIDEAVGRDVKGVAVGERVVVNPVASGNMIGNGGTAKVNIYDSPGNDILDGDWQNDTIYGGSGVDECHQGNGSGGVLHCENADLAVQVTYLGQIAGHRLAGRGVVVLDGGQCELLRIELRRVAGRPRRPSWG